MLSLGTVLITLSFLINTFAHDHVWELVLGGILIGAGITFAFAASANLIVEAVPQGEVGIATGINTVMRTVGGSFGAAIVTAILTAEHDAAADRERLHDGVRVLRGRRRAGADRVAARAAPARGCGSSPSPSDGARHLHVR